MVTASHWVGLTLPGIMEEPGSLTGSQSSFRPARGPEPIQRRSLAIFIKDTAKVFKAAEAKTSGSWQAKAANLFGAVSKGSPVARARRAAAFSAKSGGAFRPV